MAELPVLDLSQLPPEVNRPEDAPAELVRALADAAETFGFFQIVGTGLDPELREAVWAQTREFFALPAQEKRAIERTKENSRGYYDRELTKQRRDNKEVLDLAQVPHPDLADDDPSNFHRIDGVNQWPTLPEFRSTLLAWLAACDVLSRRLLGVFAIALGEDPITLSAHFGHDNTSFVRLNHYPVDDLLSPAEANDVTPLGDMALHHHTDAGALTVLLQDEVGGLQVEHDGEWLDANPIPGALVVNTGDMMQVWSNDRFQAALHRVAPRAQGRERFSLPYFYNPSYDTDYAPLGGAVGAEGTARYRTLNWGDFRQARADGDFADYGTEIQIQQFRI